MGGFHIQSGIEAKAHGFQSDQSRLVQAQMLHSGGKHDFYGQQAETEPETDKAIQRGTQAES